MVEELETDFKRQINSDVEQAERNETVPNDFESVFWIDKTPFFRMKFTQNGKRKDDVLMRELHRRVMSQAK